MANRRSVTASGVSSGGGDLYDVIITGVAQSAPSSEAGSETVSLEFAKVDWEFKPQKTDGSLDAGIHFKFDIKAGPYWAAYGALGIIDA